MSNVRPHVQVSDITTVSSDYVQGSFQLLPLSGERARAALFFANSIHLHAKDQEIEIARWYFRASLSEFKSIFDLLPKDLRSLGLWSQWSASQANANLLSHPLFSVLSKTRDFAVHSSEIRGQARNMVLRVLGGSTESEESISSVFIEPISLEHLPRIKHLSEEELVWFNRQTSVWPSHLVIREAIYQCSVPLRNFLATVAKGAA